MDKERGWFGMRFFLGAVFLNILWLVLGLEGVVFFCFSLLSLPFYAGAAARVLSALPGDQFRKDFLLQRYALHLSGILAVGIILTAWLAGVAVVTDILRGELTDALAVRMVIGTGIGWLAIWLGLWVWAALPWLARWPVSAWVWWEIHHLQPGLRDSLSASLGRRSSLPRSLVGALTGLALTTGLVHLAALSGSPVHPLVWGYILLLFPLLHLAWLSLARRALAESKRTPVGKAGTEARSDKMDAHLPAAGKVSIYSPAAVRDRSRQPILIAFRDGCGIAYHPQNPERPIELYSGPRGDVGIMLTPHEALFFRWEEHFRRAGAGWFRPYIVHLAREGRIDLELLEKDIRRHSGSPANGS